MGHVDTASTSDTEKKNRWSLLRLSDVILFFCQSYFSCVSIFQINNEYHYLLPLFIHVLLILLQEPLKMACPVKATAFQMLQS